MMRTIEFKFYELCDEIDYWKDEAKHYKNLYEELLRENAIQSKERLLEAKKGVGQALMLALSVSDMPDGSLTISKENRKMLAKSLSDSKNKS